MKTKIVFFGSSKYVIPIIDGLRKHFTLALVLTTESPKPNLALQVFDPEAQTRRDETLRSYPVVKYCTENKISYLSVSSLSSQNLKSLILNLKSEVAVLADFGLFVPDEILNIFPKGIINIHPSLLPKYRGPTPVQTAICNGEKETGVSIIKLDNEIDHGPILAQEKLQILPQDTSQSLYERLFKKGGEMLPDILNRYLNGKLKLITQNHKKATFTKHLTRSDGYIDISYNKLPKEKFQRMINAYFPWPGVWIKIGIRNNESGIKNKIIKFLPSEKIQVEGKKPMSYGDFVNGYKEGKNIINKLTIFK